MGHRLAEKYIMRVFAPKDLKDLSIFTMNVFRSSYRHYIVLNNKNLWILMWWNHIYIFLCSVCMSDSVATDEWTQSVTVLRSGSFHVDRGRRRRRERGRGGYRQRHRGDQERGRRESNWWRESKRERERWSERLWATLRAQEGGKMPDKIHEVGKKIPERN